MDNHPTVLDMTRPNIDGTTAKMQGIADRLRTALPALPVVGIAVNDNLMSSIWLRVSFAPRCEWENGIWENSPYMGFMITTASGKRYYEEGDPITITQPLMDSGLMKTRKAWRKLTASPDKAVAKLAAYLSA